MLPSYAAATPRDGTRFRADLGAAQGVTCRGNLIRENRLLLHGRAVIDSNHGSAQTPMGASCTNTP